MFTRFISLLVLVAPLASATIILKTPPPSKNGDNVTITWTSQQGDPASFSLQLVNPSFNNVYAVANNVITDAGSLSEVFPVVLAGTYVLQAFNNGDNSDIYSSTDPFSIGDATSTTGSTTSTATTSGASSNTLSTVTTGTSTTGAGRSSIGASTGTSLSGTSLSGTSSSGTSPSGTSPSEAAASATSSSAAVSSRLALTNACGYAVLLLSAVGGAVAVAF